MTSAHGGAGRDGPEKIYHLVPAAALRGQTSGGRYSPEGLARDGFVHCASRAAVLAVADDYHADVQGPLLVLEIDPAGLLAETHWEAPVPIAGGGTRHLEGAALFPHVYGPIDIRAVTAVGVLERSSDGYAWPERFEPVAAFLDE